MNGDVLCLVSSLTLPFIRIRFRDRYRKTVSVLPFRKRRCRSRHTGEWPRQAQLAGGRVSRSSEWAELQASYTATEKIELDPI